jgi:hypothetical protein
VQANCRCCWQEWRWWSLARLLLLQLLLQVSLPAVLS